MGTKQRNGLCTQEQDGDNVHIVGQHINDRVLLLSGDQGSGNYPVNNAATMGLYCKILGETEEGQEINYRLGGERILSRMPVLAFRGASDQISASGLERTSTWRYSHNLCNVGVSKGQSANFLQGFPCIFSLYIPASFYKRQLY